VNTTPLLQGLTVLERGWLSSNNVLLHGQTPDEPAVLVDSSHVLHAPQTVALVQHALQGAPLARVINTHLHSDHCGGNASVQRAFRSHGGCALHIPVGSWQAASAWDEDALSYRATGQQCERFVPDARISPGDTLSTGGRHWQVLAAPGHDPQSVMLFDSEEGVLISADALWANGFGVVFPELDGEQAFDDVARVLELIAQLDARCVIPGHGAPFTDVADALQRARKRLSHFVADPQRHHHHAMKVLVKYHLMEVRQEPLATLWAWLQGTPLCVSTFGRVRPAQAASADLAAYGQQVLDELIAAGAARQASGMVFNA
jgi:glyoxylase-like metal-dependent hydrolase (beta-lactamase superfamily II)